MLPLFTWNREYSRYTPRHSCLLWSLRRGHEQKMRILTLKLKTFLDSEKVFRDRRRVLLDPNDSSWTFFAICIEVLLKIFQTADSPKNERNQRSKNRQRWNFFIVAIQRFKQSIWKNSNYEDRKMCNIPPLKIYNSFDITHQAHTRGDWKIRILCHMCSNKKQDYDFFRNLISEVEGSKTFPTRPHLYIYI